MKKLMIAAAIAAMIGAAEAYSGDCAYDFAATLKTTVAKEGKGSTDKYVVNLGKDSQGDWWYNDSAFDDDGSYDGVAGVLTFDKNNIGKLNVKKLTDAQKEALMYDLEDYAFVTINGNTYFGRGTPDYYKGKAKWCATYKFNIKNPGQCYRAAGTVKIQTTYYLASCCDYGDDSLCTLESWYEKKGDIVLPDLTTDLLYRFGAEQLAKATKVEFVGQIGNGVAANGTFTDEVIPTFALAGQGNMANLKDAYGDTEWGIKDISGNIVGIWYDPECEVCCGNNGIAACWGACFSCCTHDGTVDCGGAYEYDVDAAYDREWFGTEDLEYLWGTAAYGSFTLKFNSKLSDF